MLEAPGIAVVRADKNAAALRLTSELQPLRKCVGQSFWPGSGGPCFCDIEQFTEEHVSRKRLSTRHLEYGIVKATRSLLNGTCPAGKMQWIFEAHCGKIFDRGDRAYGSRNNAVRDDGYSRHQRQA